MTIALNARRFAGAWLMGCATLGVAGVGLTGAASAETTIKMAMSSVADLENDNGMTAWVMQNYVNSHSDDLNFEVYGSSALGGDQDVLQAMQLGSGATMHVGGTAVYNSFVPAGGVLDLPFLWQDFDHVGRALDGDLGGKLDAKFEQSGFKVLGWGYSWGYRNVVTSGKAIENPEDLKGLKIRTIQSPVYVAALNAMGANATPMAFGEVYTALQTGVLDGFEHAASMVYSSKLYEVSDHVALTRHLFGPTVITYSLPLWNKLSEKDQQVLEDAAALAIEINRALAPIREQKALAQLEEVGMTITQVDTTQFSQDAVPLQDELADELGAADLLQLIRDAQ
ncbi:TRAP transporter substrate-binding protein [Pseudooceanicola sediminis]|nr:TRAP transporter substrate-binding protein [Pseudooceanicola sediminis]|tara:strand:+ start:24236 stop:25252 length:1017 start_codon:yes stop_codon:yes gene_type:complete